MTQVYVARSLGTQRFREALNGENYGLCQCSSTVLSALRLQKFAPTLPRCTWWAAMRCGVTDSVALMGIRCLLSHPVAADTPTRYERVQALERCILFIDHRSFRVPHCCISEYIVENRWLVMVTYIRSIIYYWGYCTAAFIILWDFS